MRFINEQRTALLVIAVLSLLMFWGSCSSGSTTPGAYTYNTAIATMGGTYNSNVIPVNYFVSVTTNKEGSVPLAPGFGDVYSLVEYSTNNGVIYSLCHNTAGHPGDYFTFLEAPSTQEATFNWDVDSDLGPGADVSSCILRIRVFHAGDDPCSSPPMDVETTQEFSIDLTSGTDCGEPPAITTESIPDADDEEPYSTTFEATGGYGSLTWSLGTPIDNNIVSGLSLSPLGILAGTPYVQGEYKGLNLQLSLDVWTTDECPEGARSDNGVYTLTIWPQEPVCAAPPEFYDDQIMSDGMENAHYTYTLDVEGGEGDLFFEIIAGALPDDLTLNSAAGLISSYISADTEGTYPLTFRVTDSCVPPQTDEISLELVVEAESVTCGEPPQITTEGIADGTVGDPYSETFVATGDETPLIWTYTGDLPAGLELVGQVLSGTPTEAGSFNPTIIVTDSCETPGPRSDSMEFPFIINEEVLVCADPPTITNTPDDGYEGTPYSFQFTADDGELPLSWALTAGTLPTSLTLSTDGLLSGDIDCQQTGEFEFTVEVTDSCEIPLPQTDDQVCQMTVNPQQCDLLDILDGQAIPEAMETILYFYPIEFTGGYGQLTWELTSGTLPTGLFFADGMITGIPGIESSEDYPLTVQVTDSCCTPQVDTFDFILTVVPLSQCLEEPVADLTFCLDCPDIIPVDGTELVPLYLVLPPMTTLFPTTIEINLTYDDSLVTINDILPGPIFDNPLLFDFDVDVSDFTITYAGPPAIPITRQGIFAYISMTNINTGGGGPMPFTPVATVVECHDGLAPIPNVTWMCEILVDGIPD